MKKPRNITTAVGLLRGKGGPWAKITRRKVLQREKKKNHKELEHARARRQRNQLV